MNRTSLKNDMRFGRAISSGCDEGAIGLPNDAARSRVRIVGFDTAINGIGKMRTMGQWARVGCGHYFV